MGFAHFKGGVTVHLGDLQQDVGKYPKMFLSPFGTCDYCDATLSVAFYSVYEHINLISSHNGLYFIAEIKCLHLPQVLENCMIIAQ